MRAGWYSCAPPQRICTRACRTGNCYLQLLSVIWRVSRTVDSHLTPVPKVKPVTGDGDLRPIALTPVLSKVLEDFFFEWLIHDVEHHIDPQQFGSLKGTSTTYCLLDMLHNWLSSLDCPGKSLHVCFLDFSKAFDHIDHTILVTKLIHLGVRGWLTSWICSFLSGRR